MRQLTILVVRDDRLGDLMLIAAAVQQLHRSLRAAGIVAHIHLLATLYTQPAAPLLRYVDKVHTHEPKRYHDFFVVRHALVAEKYDAAISFFSSMKSALLLATAGIPYRLAPQTKIAQFLYTNLVQQRRSRSQKPEHAYNCDLVYQFAQDFSLPHTRGAFMHHPKLPATLSQWRAKTAIVAIHPANGKSAHNIDLADYAVIAEHLLAHTHNLLIMFIAGPHEQNTTDALYRLLEVRGRCADMQRVMRYDSTDGIMSFAANISHACAFISASTGTAHVAALFDVPTVVFYADIHTAGALRWQTLNSATRRIAVSVPMGYEHLEVDAQSVAEQALTFLPTHTLAPKEEEA